MRIHPHAPFRRTAALTVLAAGTTLALTGCVPIPVPVAASSTATHAPTSTPAPTPAEKRSTTPTTSGWEGLADGARPVWSVSISTLERNGWRMVPEKTSPDKGYWTYATDTTSVVVRQIQNPDLQTTSGDEAATRTLLTSFGVTSTPTEVQLPTATGGTATFLTVPEVVDAGYAGATTVRVFTASGIALALVVESDTTEHADDGLHQVFDAVTVLDL